MDKKVECYPLCWMAIGLLLASAGNAALAREIPVKPPLPVWPSDHETITDRNPVFRLNGRFEATGYRIELACDSAFADPITIANTQVLDASGIAPVVIGPYEGEPLADGRYYWRAFAVREGENTFLTPPANYRVFFVSGHDGDAIEPTGRLVHPWLLLRRDEIAELRSRIAHSDHLQRGWNYQQNAAYGSFELTPPDESYAAGAAGQHGNYSNAAAWYSRHLGHVAFVALVNDDPGLARKGVEMLMTACSYQHWLGPGFRNREHVDPLWNSALETAMMTEAVAIGYDMLYPHLTEAQRRQVRSALVDKGIRPLIEDWVDPIGSSRIPRHQIPSGNWVAVCAGSAGVGALALLGEHPEAPHWVRLVRNRLRAWFLDRGGDWIVDNPHPHNRPNPIPVVGPSEPNFGVDGGYKETIGYMNYGTLYACLFADALRRGSGEDLFQHVPPTLLDHLAWSLLAWPVDGEVRSKFIDFGDDGGSTAWFAQLHAVLMKNRADRLAAWIYRRTIPIPIAARTLLWYDEALPESPPDTAVPMSVFPTVGHVVMRGGWSPDAPLAAIKFHQNRGHHDIGTFYLFGGGQPTIIDSGITDYASPIYYTYSAYSIAHNLVLVDDKPQTRADGKLLGAVGTSLLTAASGQLRSAYPEALSSWTRDLLMLPDGVAVVHDRLSAEAERQFDLVLHPEHPFTRRGDNQLAIGDRLRPTFVEVHADHDFTAVEQDGYYKDLPRKFVRFNARARMKDASFLTLCRWPMGSETRWAEPRVLRLPGGRWEVAESNGARLSICTAGGACEGLASDGRLAVVWDPRTDGQALHAILAGGTSLVLDGKPLLSTDKPVHAAMETGQPIRIHVWCGEPTRLEVAVDENLRFVHLDGNRVEASRVGSILQVSLPAGEHHLTVGAEDRVVPRAPRLPASDLARVEPIDAPAFRPGVRTRSSSSWTDGIDALDGNPNSAWMSLIGLPVPQWLEVILPAPESMRQVRIDTGRPAAGMLEVWDLSQDAWRTIGRFETTATDSVARLTFDQCRADRLRVTVTTIGPDSKAATIHTLSWSAEPPAPME